MATFNQNNQKVGVQINTDKLKEPSIPISKIEELIEKECFSVPTHEFESTTVIDIEDLQQLIVEAKHG